MPKKAWWVKRPEQNQGNLKKESLLTDEELQAQRAMLSKHEERMKTDAEYRRKYETMPEDTHHYGNDSSED